MIVAIAGPSADLPRCIRVRDSLRRLGLVVAYDWIADIEALREQCRFDSDLLPDERIEARRRCLLGVKRSDVVLWLAAHSEGASYEVGFADALGLPIVIAGDYRHPIYGSDGCPHWGPDRWFRSDAEAIAWLVEKARERGLK